MINKFNPTLFGDKSKWKELIDHIKSYSKKKGDGRDLKYLQSLIKGEPYPDYTLQEKLERDKKLRGLSGSLKQQKALYKELLQAYEQLEENYNISLAIKDLPEIQPIKRKNTKKHEAAIFTTWSDWHVGEGVSLQNTNSLNEYNPQIAKKRIRILMNNTVKVCKKEADHSDIKNLIVFLGGDFINGWIHMENRETNTMTPIEEIKFCTNLLIESISFLLENTDFNITLVCTVGNHGRFTKKMRYSNEIQTSFETLLYSNLVEKLSHEKRINFSVAASGVSYLDVLGKKIRYFHGHQVRYTNGVGGLSIPLNKKEAKWDETIKADFNMMGHYHQCSLPNGRTMLNGSLVGYNAFAQNFGFPYEPAQQGLILYHTKYGFTGFHKILAE